MPKASRQRAPGIPTRAGALIVELGRQPLEERIDLARPVATDVPC